MKQNLLTILFTISLISSFGQTSIEGTFLDERDTLVFKNDTMSLSIMSNGGLIFPIEGTGVYIISESNLIIKTGKNPNKPVQEKTTKELGDTEYLEEETVVFKISEQGENHLELILIGICDNSEFQGRKTIKRFERNHKKFIYRKRELKRKTNANNG